MPGTASGVRYHDDTLSSAYCNYYEFEHGRVSAKLAVQKEAHPEKCLRWERDTKYCDATLAVKNGNAIKNYDRKPFA